MTAIDETDPDAGYASQTAPWFTQKGNASGGATDGLSTTTDDSNTNILLNRVALDLGSQNDDIVAALNAILAAINAKPSA